MSTIQAVQKVLSIAQEERKKTFRHRKLCLMTTIDVRNAFNSASWALIVRNMREKNIPPYLIRCIQSYFTGRKLISPNGETRDMTAGACQGSVAGPWLWNLLYDGLLRTQMPIGITLVAYADDLAVISVAKSETELIRISNLALERVQRWMTENELEMAPEKTEAVLLIGRKKCRPVTVNVSGIEITPKKHIKYLGVHVDKNLDFSTHIEETVTKANARSAALIRILPRTRGPGWMKRRTLYHVFASTVLYAAPVWGMAMKVKKYKNRMIQAQRKIVLNVSRAYRTASTEAIQVIAGILPIDIAVTEREKTFRKPKEERREERDLSIQAWDNKWKNGTTGEWTRILIVDVEPWINRKHGEVTYHLTQFLTGHGCFNAYLFRFKLRTCPKCRYCCADDSVEHTFFRCMRWQQHREQMNTQVHDIMNKNNIVSTMLRSEEHWKTVQTFVHTVLEQKEKDERIEKIRTQIRDHNNRMNE
ncbi:hypothetical protein WDU94_000619 [Cyamophila willieti]